VGHVAGAVREGAVERRRAAVANFDDYTPAQDSQMPDLDISIIANTTRRRAAASPVSR